MAELNEVSTREHDQIAGVKRVSLFPSSAKGMVDYTTTSNVVYIGKAAPGTATSTAKSWFIEKVDYSSGVTTTHATDSWDNRATTAIYS